MPFEQMPQICDLTLTDPQHQLVITRRIHAVSARFSSIVYCQSVRRSSKTALPPKGYLKKSQHRVFYQSCVKYFVIMVEI